MAAPLRQLVSGAGWRPAALHAHGRGPEYLSNVLRIQTICRCSEARTLPSSWSK